MKIPACLRRRVLWLNVPSTLIITLLQRTPAVKMMPASGEMMIATPLGTVLRSVFAGVASVGIHTIAGATQLSSSQASPASATVGTPVTIAFSITGTVSEPESWTVGGTTPPGLSFSGQGGSVLTLSGTPTTAGSYVVMVQAHNADPSYSTSNYSFTVNVAAGGGQTAPAITTQPQGSSVTVGANVTFTAAASGNPAPTYQWRKDGSAVSGATSATLSLTNVQTGDAGTYTVVATNSAGSATSNGAVLAVSVALVAPSFTTQPVSQTVAPGASATFTAAASGNPAPTFQWRRNGTNISGATNATLTLTNVQAADAGTYTVLASSSAGSATSDGAVLTVSAATVAPAFTAQPSSQTVTSGGTATFTATASGNPAPTFQWRKNGTNVSGATSATLTLTNVQSADAGTYTVVATNSAGSATSNGAVLTVSTAVAPTITTQPFSQVVALSSTFTLTVVATGQAPLAYQWSKDGSVITGATAASYSVASVTAGHAGSYTVVVTSGQGSVTSNAAVVGVGTPIPGRLANLSVRVGAGADAQTLIVGFIIGGGSKQVVLRGLGPTLSLPPFNVIGALADPKLQIFGSVAGLPSNENWGDGNASTSLGVVFNTIGAYPLDPASKDAGLLTTLASGDYTAWVTGATGTSGIALAEIFDTEGTGSAGYLANISARAQVGTGDSVLIVGFIISGNVPKQVLIRALGPALAGAPYNVPGSLADPRLDLYPSGATVPSTSNDNWADGGAGAALTAAFAATGAQAIQNTSSKDAAMLVTLAPGGYTAIVSGVNATTGVALTELFQMP